MRRLLRWAGYPIVGLGTFLVCAQLTFPYARVRDRLVAALGADDGSRLARGWVPGRFTLQDVTLAQFTARACDRDAGRRGASNATPPLRPDDIGDKGGRPGVDSDLPPPPPEAKAEEPVQPLVLEY